MAADEDPEPDGRLRQVYGFDDPAEVRDYYDAWASTYDAELAANGYALPERAATVLIGLADDPTAPVLDYGCGTGLSGTALAEAGFTTIDGADPSTGMLRHAEATGSYRRLVELDLDAPGPPFDPESYAIVTAIGVIGPGAAPLTLFGALLDLVAPGGLFGVSFNDYAMGDPAYPAAIRSTVDGGRFEIAFEDRGAHLPGIDVQSTLYVFRRV